MVAGNFFDAGRAAPDFRDMKTIRRKFWVMSVSNSKNLSGEKYILILNKKGQYWGYNFKAQKNNPWPQRGNEIDFKKSLEICATRLPNILPNVAKIILINIKNGK